MIMTDVNYNDPKEWEKRQADSALSAVPGSELRIAMAGYMADRHELIRQIKDASLYYNHEKEKRQWMIQEIERIDSIVEKKLRELSDISIQNAEDYRATPKT
jgi:hypothetical protein